MATPMSVIARLANAQGNAFPRGDSIPWTGARAQTFCGLSMFLAANDMKEFISASDTVETPFDFSVSSTSFGPKRPAADHKTAEGGEILFMKTALTEYEWASKYTWHEKALQGNSVFSPEGSQRFYSLLQKREKDFTLDPLLEMEKALFATPTDDMFGSSNSTGVLPIQSIWTKINEWEDQYGTTENLFPGMSLFQGLNPADSRFKRVDSYGAGYQKGSTTTSVVGGSQLAPTKVKYNEGGNADVGPKHMLEQMRYLMGLLNWSAVPMAGEFGEGLTVTPRVIMCTREADRFFSVTNRAHGEFFATINPIGDPSQGTARFGGVSLQPCDSLRDAKIYPDVGDGSDAQRLTAVDRAPLTELEAGAPRFYFFDAENINLWFHRDRAWEIGPWKSMAPLNEDVMRRLGKSIMNLHAERVMTSGILVPETDAGVTTDFTNFN